MSNSKLDRFLDWLPATRGDLKRANNELKELIMGLSQDLSDAADLLIQKNDALIALVGQLVDAAKNNPPAAEVQAVVDKLKAEAAKDDQVLNPPPPTP